MTFLEFTNDGANILFVFIFLLALIAGICTIIGSFFHLILGLIRPNFARLEQENELLRSEIASLRSSDDECEEEEEDEEDER